MYRSSYTGSKKVPVSDEDAVREIIEKYENEMDILEVDYDLTDGELEFEDSAGIMTMYDEYESGRGYHGRFFAEIQPYLEKPLIVVNVGITQGGYPDVERFVVTEDRILHQEFPVPVVHDDLSLDAETETVVLDRGEEVESLDPDVERDAETPLAEF